MSLRTIIPDTGLIPDLKGTLNLNSTVNMGPLPETTFQTPIILKDLAFPTSMSDFNEDQLSQNISYTCAYYHHPEERGLRKTPS